MMMMIKNLDDSLDFRYGSTSQQNPVRDYLIHHFEYSPVDFSCLGKFDDLIKNVFVKRM